LALAALAIVVFGAYDSYPYIGILEKGVAIDPTCINVGRLEQLILET